MAYRFATAIGKALAAATDAAAAVAALASSAKTTPVDADSLLLVDSAASDAPKKLTLANLKTALFSSPTLTTPVINGLPTGTGVSNSATASTLVARDANKIVFANKFLASATTVVASGGTTDLLWSSRRVQICTGSTTHAFRLAKDGASSGVLAGEPHIIMNATNSTVTAKASDGTTLPGGALSAGTMGEWFPIIDNPVTYTDWMKR